MGAHEYPEWKIEEDVPSFEDPFIQKYLNGRDALVEEERKQRHGEIRLSTPISLRRVLSYHDEHSGTSQR